MTITAENMTIGRLGFSDSGTKNSHLDFQARQRELMGTVWVFKTSRPSSSDTCPPTKPHPLALPISPINWGQVFKYMSIEGHSHPNHHLSVTLIPMPDKDTTNKKTTDLWI